MKEHPPLGTLLDALLGEGPETRADDVERHLAACPECRRAAEGYRLLLDEVGKSPPMEPSEGTVERVLGATVARRPRPLPVRPLFWIPVSAAAALAFLLLLRSGQRPLERALPHGRAPSHGRGPSVGRDRLGSRFEPGEGAPSGEEELYHEYLSDCRRILDRVGRLGPSPPAEDWDGLLRQIRDRNLLVKAILLRKSPEGKLAPASIDLLEETQGLFDDFCRAHRRGDAERMEALWREALESGLSERVGFRSPDQEEREEP